MKVCYYCNEYYCLIFKTVCCERIKKDIYLCKSCLHQNYSGMRVDFHHPKECPFCYRFPRIKLVK